MSPVFRHGRLRLYLLKLLDESPRHGYEVIRLLQDRFLGVYSPSPGTIYPRLTRLEEEGLVTRDEVEGKKVYRITEKGRQELRGRIDELSELEDELTASARGIALEIGRDVRDTVRSLREELGRAAAKGGHDHPWHRASEAEAGRTGPTAGAGHPEPTSASASGADADGTGTAGADAGGAGGAEAGRAATSGAGTGGVGTGGVGTGGADAGQPDSDTAGQNRTGGGRADSIWAGAAAAGSAWAAGAARPGAGRTGAGRAGAGRAGSATPGPNWFTDVGQGPRLGGGHGPWTAPASWPDLERLAADFVKEILAAAVRTRSGLDETGLRDVRGILADALTRIRTEVFGPADQGSASEPGADDAPPTA